MLKKVIIGIICFILLAVAGAGIYIYTLNWNKHKALVAERLTQITGLKSQIDGNLKVVLFPQPKVTAGRVKFFSDTDGITPLVVVNEITANLELSPLFDNKFIIQSMRLEQPTVNLILSEKGEFNWKNAGKNSHNKSGNVEVSFDKVQLNDATVIFTNSQKQTEYTIANISADISAPALQGPYKTNGKFIYNNSELRFVGTISQKDEFALNMTVDNAITGSKFIIDGTLGDKAKGTVTFDTHNLTNIANTIFGEGSLNNNYAKPFFFSFQYDYNADIAKFDNFTTQYDQNITGSGSVSVNTKNENVVAEFNMTQFNLDVLETIVRDYVQFIQKGGNYEDILISPYNIAFKLRSPSAFYKNTEAQSLSLGFNLNKEMLDITNFSLILSGESTYKAVGKINLNDKLQYVLNQSFKSEDFRTFASIFGIDLTKQTSPEYKKSVFKRVIADKIQAKGDLDNLSVYAPQVSVDSTKLGFNIHFLRGEENSSLNAEIAASKILFDKYLQVSSEEIKNGTVEDKFIYQLKLIPWGDNISTTAKVAIENAVYNKIPMNDIALQFTKDKDNLNVRSLSIKNIAGASLELKADAEKIFTEPQFKELSYNIKTTNFPAFTSTVGINTNNLDLFKRKLFAAQGAMAGTFKDFSLSSVQKFGDTEFSYTGLVSNPKKEKAVINGDLEIKTNNFTNFIKALNLDYTPRIPVSVFTMLSKVKGNVDIFELSDINAHIGANKISGLIQLDKTTDKPKLKAQLDFDRFDADRWFNLPNKKDKTTSISLSDFISKPDFDDEKIDYSSLTKVNFDVEANSRSFIYDNTTYQTTKIKALLKDGVLNVSSFETKNDANDIKLNFVLNTTKEPLIEGKYDISGIKLPTLGGQVYQISNGTLAANGTFSSRAGSQKEFFEDLNSDGDFQVLNPIVKGWDLDVIKFDIEQRKDTNGFEDFVKNSLKTGKSAFTKISGQYNVIKGNVVADDVLWQSPVVDMSMLLNLNLSDYLFKAVFDAIYHNASFSDVLKFTMDGNLSTPKLQPNLEDTLTRIQETEKSSDAAKKQKENEKNEKIKDKQNSIAQNITSLLEKVSGVSADVAQYVPLSKDRTVANTYNDAINQIKATETRLVSLQDKLASINDEKALADIEGELKIENSKLQIITKTIEDNYVVDGKYVYDELFNKISWVYNVASHNVAYFNGLSEAYIKQLNLIKKGTNPLPEETETKLLKSIKKVSQDMEKISSLHTRMRDDYLFIVDTTDIVVMKDNIEIAEQALKTILSYTQILNKDIVSSVEDFIIALELSSRDYNDYMVSVPERIEDIDISAPTTNSPKKKAANQPIEKETFVEAPVSTAAEPEKEEIGEPVVEVEDNTSPQAADDVSTPSNDVVPQTDNSELQSSAVDEDKKKSADKLAKLQAIQTNLYTLIDRFKAEQKAKKEIKLAANISSVGLSSLLSLSDDEETEINEAQNETVNEIVLAQNDITESKTDVSAQTDNEAVAEPEPAIVSDVESKSVEEVISAEIVDETVAETTDIEQPVMASAASSLPVVNETIDNVAVETTLPQEPIVEVAAVEETVTIDVTPLQQHLKAEPVNVTDYIIATDEGKTTLKRNPVIALEIGKELSNVSNFMGNIKQKSAFKFKKARYNDVIQSFADKPAKLPLVAQQAVSKTTSAPQLNGLPTVAVSNDERNPFDVRFVEAQVLPKEQTPVSNNQFIFATQTVIPVMSGKVGKTILPEKKTVVVDTPNKYVFAANNLHLTSTNGSLGKIKSLYVK